MDYHSKVVVTTSWDDGDLLDLKLADLLLELGIKGTFYISPHNKECSSMEASQLRDLSEYFEIGAHSLTHPDLRHLNDKQLENEIRNSKLELENTLGKPVRMFCYPGGKFDRRVQLAVDRAGFIGARTTREFSIECGKIALEMPTTLHVFPHSPLIRIRHGLLSHNWRGIQRYLRIGVRKKWTEIAQCFFEEALKAGGVWHLWGHSWEIEKYKLWDDLKLVLNTIANREDIKYLTNGELIKNVDEFTIC